MDPDQNEIQVAPGAPRGDVQGCHGAGGDVQGYHKTGGDVQGCFGDVNNGFVAVAGGYSMTTINSLRSGGSGLKNVTNTAISSVLPDIV